MTGPQARNPPLPTTGHEEATGPQEQNPPLSIMHEEATSPQARSPPLPTTLGEEATKELEEFCPFVTITFPTNFPIFPDVARSRGESIFEDPAPPCPQSTPPTQSDHPRKCQKIAGNAHEHTGLVCIQYLAISNVNAVKRCTLCASFNIQVSRYILCFSIIE